MSFVWTPALSVGVDSVDAQHRELFRRVNAVLAAAGGGHEQQEILRTLAFLGSYIVSHFADEERLMREAGYPGLAAHLAEHARLDEAFCRLRSGFARHGLDDALVRDVRREVCAWLEQHVQGVDRALGQWLAERSLGLPPPVRASA